MGHSFYKCNSCKVFIDDVISDGNETDVLNQQSKFKRLGFIVDTKNDLFVKPSVGALVFFCGECNTLDKLLSETKDINIYFDIPEMIDNGYQFVVAPVTNKIHDVVNGISYGHALFCSNYEEILDRKKAKKR